MSNDYSEYYVVRLRSDQPRRDSRGQKLKSVLTRFALVAFTTGLCLALFIWLYNLVGRPELNGFRRGLAETPAAPIVTCSVYLLAYGLYRLRQMRRLWYAHIEIFFGISYSGATIWNRHRLESINSVLGDMVMMFSLVSCIYIVVRGLINREEEIRRREEAVRINIERSKMYEWYLDNQEKRAVGAEEKKVNLPDAKTTIKLFKPANNVSRGFQTRHNFQYSRLPIN